MTAGEFEIRITEWARRRDDLEALVLGGSRARSSGNADVWSDWDFHVITRRPAEYQQTNWLNDIAPCWCAHAERTARGIIKVSAIFIGGLEVDFVPLSAWQMKLVYAAMKRPSWAQWMPDRLKRGIHETQAFMLGSGYRLVVGNEAWTERFLALQTLWPHQEFSAAEFDRHTTAFWSKAVWIFKKIARPEPRSAMHWLHLLVVQHVYPLLAEEARLQGRKPRSEARKAEQWLDARRLNQTGIETGPDQRQLARALLNELTLFQEVTQSIAARRGFVITHHAAIETWLLTQLAKVAK